MRFFVDGELIGEIKPPAGGFWEKGDFANNPGGPNIWASGSNMAPFDQPVSHWRQLIQLGTDKQNQPSVIFFASISSGTVDGESSSILIHFLCNSSTLF